MTEKDNLEAVINLFNQAVHRLSDSKKQLYLVSDLIGREKLAIGLIKIMEYQIMLGELIEHLEKQKMNATRLIRALEKNKDGDKNT